MGGVDRLTDRLKDRICYAMLCYAMLYYTILYYTINKWLNIVASMLIQTGRQAQAEECHKQAKLD